MLLLRNYFTVLKNYLNDVQKPDLGKIYKEQLYTLNSLKTEFQEYYMQKHNV